MPAPQFLQRHYGKLLVAHRFDALDRGHGTGQSGDARDAEFERRGSNLSVVLEGLPAERGVDDEVHFAIDQGTSTKWRIWAVS